MVLSDNAVGQLDARVKLLRDECWREIHEHADDKPAYALLRVYSKMKMFCEFYDGLRKGGGDEPDDRNVGTPASRNGCKQQGTPAEAGEDDNAKI